MLIGKRDEIELLESLHKSKSAEFTIIHGKRKVGKTQLIKEFLKGKYYIYYSAVKTTNRDQLDKLSTRILNNSENNSILENYNTWDELFQGISEMAGREQRLVFVIDNFENLVENNKEIINILENKWKEILINKNIMIVLSGITKVIKEKVLKKGTLISKIVTSNIIVNELDFEEAKHFMPNNDIKESIVYYSIFSGMPYYLNKICKDKSIKENIINNILNINSTLFNEPEITLKQELRDINNYNAIIEAIALDNVIVNDIYSKTKIDKNKLPYYINSLIDLGIIDREYPVTLSKKEKEKSKIGQYKMINSYFRFYYSFIFPNISELIVSDEEKFYDEIIEPKLESFIALEFKNICMQRMQKLNASKIGRWWDKDNAIDIISIDDNNNYIFADCTWSNEKINIDKVKELKRKSSLVSDKIKDVYYMFFSKEGFSKELIKESVIDTEVILIDINDNI